MDKEFLQWLDKEAKSATADRQDAKEENKNYYTGQEYALSKVIDRIKDDLWREALK